MNTAELEKKLATLYSESHEYPSLRSLKWPDDFAKEAVALFEALATHRAVELAHEVIGEDEPFSGVKEWSQQDFSITRNKLRTEQRAALAQLQGLEGKDGSTR